LNGINSNPSAMPPALGLTAAPPDVQIEDYVHENRHGQQAKAKNANVVTWCPRSSDLEKFLLLQRIASVASRPSQLVLDPFQRRVARRSDCADRDAASEARPGRPPGAQDSRWRRRVRLRVLSQDIRDGCPDVSSSRAQLVENGSANFRALAAHCRLGAVPREGGRIGQRAPAAEASHPDAGNRPEPHQRRWAAGSNRQRDPKRAVAGRRGRRAPPGRRSLDPNL